MSDKCQNCEAHKDVELISDCLICGAPVCCPACCRESVLERRIAELEAASANHVLEIERLADENRRLREQVERYELFAGEVERISNEISYTGDDRDVKISCRLYELRNPSDLFDVPQEQP
jgi:hypothetical protein